MPIVVDANIALNAVAAAGAIVPELWRWEVQDVMRRLNLAGRLTKPVDFIRAELSDLPIIVDDEPASLFGDEATIAARYNLTVYDSLAPAPIAVGQVAVSRLAPRPPAL